MFLGACSSGEKSRESRTASEPDEKQTEPAAADGGGSARPPRVEWSLSFLVFVLSHVGVCPQAVLPRFDGACLNDG
jgi:hypothetical protein